MRNNSEIALLLKRWILRIFCPAQGFFTGIGLFVTPGFTCRETAGSQPKVIEQLEHRVKDQAIEMSAATIEQKLWSRSPLEPYKTATLTQIHELSRSIHLAAEIRSLTNINSLRESAKKANYEVSVWRFNDSTLIALLESESNFSGLGNYVFRLSDKKDPNPLLVQAPHSYFDTGTGKLALRTFLSEPSGPYHARALFVNTKHRYTGEDGKKLRRSFNPADVCHNSEHPFNFATEAFAQANPSLRVIQLHGFSSLKHPEKSTSVAPKLDKPIDDNFKVILSAGDIHVPSNSIRELRDRLRSRLNFQFLLFPEDTDQLGATSNVQGRLLRRYPSSTFVHIEISKEARKLLGREKTRFRAFADELLKLGFKSDQ